MHKIFIITTLLLLWAAPLYAQEDTLTADAGPNVHIIAGEEIALRADITGGEEVACTWTITTPVPRFNLKDAGRVLSEACDYTIPGSFTAERTGPIWTVELRAESADGQVAVDTVRIRVSPDTMNNLILGYAVIFGIGLAFIGSMTWRMHKLRRQAAVLAEMANEAGE